MSAQIITLDIPYDRFKDPYTRRLAETFRNIRHTWIDNTLYVTFDIDKKIWDGYRKTSLGMLYGTDLGNYLSRIGVKMKYAVPVVNDSKRAKAGVKHILVEYRFDGSQL